LPRDGASATLGRVIVSPVRQTIRRRDLMRRGERVIVACSGGPDSVAMAHALSRIAGPLELSLTVAVVDHGLRDVRDELALVEALATRLALPFRRLEVSIEGDGSVQAAARDARYAALLELARGEGASRVAVGHTRDDQAETVLDRLLRGASVAGLSGIEPRRDDGVVRPLLDLRRADVLAHLAHHDLAHATDPSNADRRFERVRIRNEVMPMLAAEDPAIVDHLAQVADDARAARDLVRDAGSQLLEEARRGAGASVENLAAAHQAARREALRRLLGEALGAPPRRSHLVAVDDLITGLVGKSAEVRLGDDLVVRVSGAELICEEVPKSPGRNGPSSPNH